MTEEMQTKTCPYCGEEININAIKCKHCGEFLNENQQEQTTEPETKICPFCGEEIAYKAVKCKHCGEFLDDTKKSLTKVKHKQLPPELKKFNWGALCLTWIWGIGNNVRIALWGLASILMFIPVIGWVVAIALLVFQIWLGINGNKLAWENKNWENAEQFNKVQKQWAMWGVILMFGIPFIIGFISGFIGAINHQY